MSTLKEEARLAAVIMKIDEEAMLVPRGAFLRSPAGIVMKNGSFSGLDQELAKSVIFRSVSRKSKSRVVMFSKF